VAEGGAGVGGGIHRRDEIAQPLEFLRYRR
jgi:hypothetical protein